MIFFADIYRTVCVTPTRAEVCDQRLPGYVKSSQSSCLSGESEYSIGHRGYMIIRKLSFIPVCIRLYPTSSCKGVVHKNTFLLCCSCIHEVIHTSLSSILLLLLSILVKSIMSVYLSVLLYTGTTSCTEKLRSDLDCPGLGDG